MKIGQVRQLPLERRALLNPAFGASALALCAREFSGQRQLRLPFETCYLVLPFVLPHSIRGALPKMVTSSLVVWLQENPVERARLAVLVERMVPISRDAMLFGHLNGIFDVSAAGVATSPLPESRRQAVARSMTPESQDIWKRAEWLGRWFAVSPDSATVYAMIGIKP